MRRLILALLVAAPGAACLGGCVGPEHNRLYCSEWKANRRTPIPVYRNWKYQGETWERVELRDGDQP
jgi:hypothetical protein